MNRKTCRKICTAPAQAKRCDWRGVSKGRAARCALKPSHGDKDVGNDPAAKSGQKFLRGGREQLRFLKAALQIKQFFVEMLKKKKQHNPNLILGWGWAPAPGAGWEVKGGALGDICRCWGWGCAGADERDLFCQMQKFIFSAKKNIKSSEMFPKRNLGNVCWALVSSWIHWSIFCFSTLFFRLKELLSHEKSHISDPERRESSVSKEKRWRKVFWSLGFHTAFQLRTGPPVHELTAAGAQENDEGLVRTGEQRSLLACTIPGRVSALQQNSVWMGKPSSTGGTYFFSEFSYIF